ncbi:MIP/aquaporin family protein [Enterococcus olivae]
MNKALYGECLAEAIGTFVFVLLGLASVAILIVTGTDISYGEMAVVWGIGVSLGIYIAGFVSGAHLNPAVTISLAIWAKFPWKKVVSYIIAQTIGAFVAAATVYGLFRSVIVNYEVSNNIVRGTADGVATSGIFATSAGVDVSMINAFFVEFTITMILMLVIFSVTDGKNGGAPTSGLPAIVIGLTVTICGQAFGTLSGFAMNPARDLGPRLFTLISGWGSQALGESFYGLIVPIFGPILGAIFAGLIYFKLIVPYYSKTEA